ncbi:MAG: hypothetical protein JWQ96_2228 [Segetibacter sp.]|nr:hypothetical protein [Segetibacter sp.]
MINKTAGIFRIGTSNIVVPGSKETFPPEFQQKSRLNYYASLFNTLEVNSTFKKIPMLSTFAKWSAEVPEDFLFTLKLWKEVTHIKQLNIKLANVDLFFNAAQHIGNKKGCLLVQFPASITADYSDKVEQILERLHQLNKESKWRLAVEFRSTTWYNKQFFELLNNFNASMVLQDMPKSKNLDLDQGADFIYYRFHGPKGDYRGSYSNEIFEEQAERMRGFLSDGKDVYAYFNNTMGSAYDNAMSLKAAVEKYDRK